MILAHISDNAKQSLLQHCRSSAIIAKNDLKTAGLGNIAYLAALFHDCGKANKAFQQYLLDSFNGKAVKRGSVIHSFAGVVYFLNEYHNSFDAIEKITAEIISYSIGAHHGLFDIFDSDKQNGFEKRLAKQPDYDSRAIADFLNEVADKNDAYNTFKLSAKEIEAVLKRIAEIINSNSEYSFYLGLLCRLVASAVMDGDRTDTMNFSIGKQHDDSINQAEIWDIINRNITQRIELFPSDTLIRKSRRELSDICLSFAENGSGVYRLNIPTGGGKTLSALRFAAAHSLINAKKRVFYIAPLISILEQNASEIKNTVGEKYVLEHHSDVIIENENSEELDLRKYLEDSWDSPVVATTFAQFLNTLFSSKTSCVRRFQALSDSVIIVDEVQSLPSKMISLFNLAVNFLSKICNCTILLCSATQPCLEDVEHPLIVDKSIINKSDFQKYAKIFKRNEVIDCGSFKLEELPSFISNKATSNRSLLVVCNKKAQAAFLFNGIKHDFGNCFHISADMCVAHRKNVLKKIKKLLSEKEPVICISTQVIEAGVDISFDCAIRLCAGMDNIIQTAGRCNRNGENGSDSPVYIVHCSDEKLKMLPDIQIAKQATDALIVDFKKRSEYYSNDLSSDASISFYYRCLYSSYSKNHFDYPLKDKPSLYEMLSDNISYRDLNQAENYFLCQSFKTAGSIFDVFDSASTSVLVPFDGGEEIINSLQNYYNCNNYTALKKEVKKAAQYSISVFDYRFNNLLKENAVTSICNGSFYILSSEYYDKETGLLDKPKEENRCNILIL